jgi:hypothetical protein
VQFFSADSPPDATPRSNLQEDELYTWYPCWLLPGVGQFVQPSPTVLEYWFQGHPLHRCVHTRWATERKKENDTC